LKKELKHRRDRKNMLELNNKYMHADVSEIVYGKPVYAITNKSSGILIAQIGWYPEWKRFVMFPLENSVWDIGCLKSIIDFMEALN
jgi:hypothetical protein